MWRCPSVILRTPKFLNTKSNEACSSGRQQQDVLIRARSASTGPLAVPPVMVVGFSGYHSHLSARQKRFQATINPPNSHRILPSLRNRCSGGKFVVSRTGAAYNAHATRSKLEIPAYISQFRPCYQQ